MTGISSAFCVEDLSFGLNCSPTCAQYPWVISLRLLISHPTFLSFDSFLSSFPLFFLPSFFFSQLSHPHLPFEVRSLIAAWVCVLACEMCKVLATSSILWQTICKYFVSYLLSELEQNIQMYKSFKARFSLIYASEFTLWYSRTTSNIRIISYISFIKIIIYLLASCFAVHS